MPSDGGGDFAGNCGSLLSQVFRFIEFRR